MYIKKDVFWLKLYKCKVKLVYVGKVYMILGIRKIKIVKIVWF